MANPVTSWTSVLLYLWDFPIKNIGVGCPFLLQKTFLTQGSNMQEDSLPLALSREARGHLDQPLFESGEMMARVSGGGVGESHGIPPNSCKFQWKKFPA